MNKCLVISPVYSHVNEHTNEVMKRASLPWKQLVGCSDLVRARSVLLTEAMNSGADRIILLDADVVPNIEQLRDAATVDLVDPNNARFGMYTLKSNRWSVEPETEISLSHDFPIVSGGLGFVALHVESLKKVGSKMTLVLHDGVEGECWIPFCLPFMDGGQYYPEDASLCSRLRSVGVNLTADPTWRVGHAMHCIRTSP